MLPILTHSRERRTSASVQSPLCSYAIVRPYRTAARRAVIKSSSRRWLIGSLISPGSSAAARAVFLYIAALGVNVLICRRPGDELCIAHVCHAVLEMSDLGTGRASAQALAESATMGGRVLARASGARQGGGMRSGVLRDGGLVSACGPRLRTAPPRWPGCGRAH
jgi:hypothetical protein